MADAPSGGDSGWGALEVILAVVLGIGVISTLTGNTIGGSSKTPSTASSAKSTASHSTAYGCTVVVTNPIAKQSIDSQFTVSGTVDSCDSSRNFPTTLYAQVVDSKGTVLSQLTPIAISRDIFGDIRFSATVQLTGSARSTSATVIVSGPASSAGAALNIRVAVKLKTGTGSSQTTTTYISNPTASPTDASFVPNPNYVPPTINQTPQQTYVPPQNNYVPPQNTQPTPPSQDTGNNNGGGTGTTF
jgi:hypothetical protein